MLEGSDSSRSYDDHDNRHAPSRGGEHEAASLIDGTNREIDRLKSHRQRLVVLVVLLLVLVVAVIVGLVVEYKLAVVHPSTFNLCPFNCSGRGTCENGTLSTAFCHCDRGWEGDACNEFVGNDCPFECSGHGTCSESGACQCSADYVGIGCNTYSPPTGLGVAWNHNLSTSVNRTGIFQHLDALMSIALAHNGSRAVNLGYAASGQYVIDTLGNLTSSYTVTKQPFNFTQVIMQSTPVFSVGETEFAYNVDFTVMSYSPNARIDGALFDGSAGQGCEASDFDEFVAGSVAIVERGECGFNDKTHNAQRAGAVAAVIYDDNAGGLFAGTLGSANFSIPALGVSNGLGLSLLDETTATVTITIDAAEVTTTTFNVIAESTHGREDSSIVVGSHLDSVEAGPGINDNGSGSASVLQTALMYDLLDLPTVENRVIFAWWGAEELGLIGSYAYMGKALRTGLAANLSVALNYDMLGSPNGIRGVHTVEPNDTTLAPPGSSTIAQMYQTYLETRGLAWKPSPMKFVGARSDYGAFYQNGVAASGLDSGAEGVKNMTERELYGGFANAWYDPCYHQACDTVSNVSPDIVEQLAKAGADVLQQLATMKDLKGFLNPDVMTDHDESRRLRQRWSSSAVDTTNALASRATWVNGQRPDEW